MFPGRGRGYFSPVFSTSQFTSFWPWSSLSSLVLNTRSFLYCPYKHLHPIAESCIPLADNTVGPMLGTGDRLCPGLAEGTQMVPISLQKSQLCPRKPESKKWQFTQIASPQEKKQSKSLWGKRGWSFCLPCPTWWETLWRKHLWDPRGMSTMSYSIHSEHSREKYLLWCLLDLLTYNSPLTPLWPQWPPHGSRDLPRAFLPQGSAPPARSVWNTLAGYVTPSLTFLRSPLRYHLLRDPPGWLYHKYHMLLVTFFTLIQPWFSF